MDTCSICLEDIKPEHICKTLSCGHKFHFNCFKKLVYLNYNFYISCPLCRRSNTCCEKPFKQDHQENIKAMLHQGYKCLKCVCKTKQGLSCKNRPALLNYGMCHVHNKNILPKKYYRLYSEYIYFIFCLNYKWRSILYLLDIGKKIMIKYMKGNEQVHNVLEYYYRYLNIKIKEEDTFHIKCMYKYYELEHPPSDWLDYCVNKNIII
mgnify:FL=1